MSHSRSGKPVPVGVGSTTLNPHVRPAARPRPDVDALAEGVRKRDRVLMGQALSLVESTREQDRKPAMALLDQCQRMAGSSVRIAISGAPGAGKSTLIDALGTHLTGQGLQVAVLAVDPTSARSGGSILGDKTRMPRLAADPLAFIRPSPSSGVLGGVGRYTRPAISVCEAAGYDVILVETVGVGQSETAVRDMVDFFLLLSLAGAGDELQGIKRGIVEVADAIVVTKADGANASVAESAAARLQSVLRLLPPGPYGWQPPALTCSALERTGIADLWNAVQAFLEVAEPHLDDLRASQRVLWFEDEVLARRAELAGNRQTQRRMELMQRVRAGGLHPYSAAEAFLSGE